MSFDLPIPKINLGDAFENLSDGFEDIADKFKEKAKEGVSALTKLWRGAGSSLRDVLKPVIEEVFNKLEALLKETSIIINQLLDKSKVLAEDLLKQAFEKLSKLVADIDQRVANLLNQIGAVAAGLIVKVRNELLEPFIEEANKFRESLISDLKELLNDAIEKVSGQVNQVIYKTDVIVTGTLSGLTDELYKIYADTDDWDIRNLFDADQRREHKRHENCKQKHNIPGSDLKLLGNGKLYDYLECKDTKRLYEEFERLNGDVKIGSLLTTYADLQERAWKLACLGRNSNLQDKALEGFVKYGQLYQLWDQFEDDMTAFTVMEQQIKELNDKIKRLDDEIEAFRNKSAQLDTLSANLQAVQAVANAAQTAATNAQSTANAAQNAAANAQGTANAAQNAATNAQATADGAVKNIEFFVVDAAVNTRVQANDVVINFPDAVDAVALQHLGNDAHQITRAQLTQLNSTAFKVQIFGVNGNGHHWIPSLRFLGIKVRR